MTRPIALRIMGVLWVALGWGWTMLPPRPEIIPWAADVRPLVWVAVGLLVIVAAGRERSCWVGIAAMGLLVGERIAALVVAYTGSGDPFVCFTAANWIGTYLAVVFAAGLRRLRP